MPIRIVTAVKTRSNHYEGFGIGFFEAMAADCIVIARDYLESAAAEVIVNADFLIEPTLDALTETLSWKSVTQIVILGFVKI
ncbi:glycosyltransferase [Halorubrum halodurans]|uniref:glycosyltransferase n=1 Tax=Halorubrum halodurans TaxID=1383851 RepID=UPI000B99A511|nr:glycosyltransferase [Halorubrum halodurans]